MNSGTLALARYWFLRTGDKSETKIPGQGRLFRGYEKKRRLLPMLKQFVQINSVKQIIKSYSESEE